MAENNYKAKIVAVLKCLLEKSDENHPVHINEIMKYLSLYNIKAERKSIYSDIMVLQDMGYDIIYENNKGYYIAVRDFELPELCLLADCVNASKFITKKKSRILINKIKGLTSEGNAKKLNRNIYTSGGTKSLNEKIYYTVDFINEAINNNKKISFLYYEYLPNKSKKLRNNGKRYIVSPYSLCVSEENYYLVSYYNKHDGLTNFRVDKMDKIEILKENSVDVHKIMGDSFQAEEYTKNMFSMFHGDIISVKLLCDNSIINPIIDKFGEDVFIRREDKEHFIVTTNINISPTFYGWLFTFGNKIRIISPTKAAEDFKNFLLFTCENYL